MPGEFQDFTSEECQKLIPQGTVLHEQRFVRTTILEITLDELVLNWSDADGVDVTPAGPSKGVVGIPAWVIDANTQKMLDPKAWKNSNGLQSVVGLDRTVFPSTQEPEALSKEIKVSEKELVRGNGHIEIGEKVIKLDSALRKRLLLEGKLQIRRGKQRVEIRLKKTRPPRSSLKPSAQANLASGKQLAFSTVSDDRTIAYHRFRLLLQEGFGDAAALIEAFLADPRSGEFHDDSYTQIDLISSFDDETFALYLEIAKELPQWKKLVAKSRTPRLPSFPIGVISVFKQKHTLNGFSRGRLVESVTLGPEESVEIEVFHFDRFIREIEENRETEVERKAERSRNQSLNLEISSDVENTVGASVGGDLGLSLPVEAVNVEGGVSGEVRNEITTRNGTTANQLTEAATTAAESFKAKHQVKTLSRHSSGTETRTKRTFRNPNLGRTLNLFNFELLAHYDLVTEVDEKARLALLVENPAIGPFDRDWIRANHHFLDKVLLHDVYRDGFDAAQILAAQEWIDELAAAEKRAKEEERQRLAEKQANESAESYFPNKGIFATARRLRKALEEFRSLGDLEDALEDLAQHVNPLEGISLQRVADAEDLISRWAWWTQFNAAYPDTSSATEDFIAAIDAAEANSSDPSVADDVISAVGGFVERFDDDWMVAIKVFASGYLIALLVVYPSMVNPLLYAYVMKLLYLPNDKGVPKLISSARADYAQHKAKQSAETLAPPSPEPDSLVPSDLPPPPPRGFSEKELADAHAALNRLKLHLEQEKVYYTNAHYKQEDPAQRMDRLRNMGVAQFIENRILGFAGNSAIYPLRLSSLPMDFSKFIEDALKPGENPNRIERSNASVSIPTGGFVSEAVVGQCDVLEPYLKERRDIEKRVAVAQVEMLELDIQDRKDAVVPENG